jgi:hypothetical protein
MPLQLDHVVIAVNSLEQAMDDYRALGFSVIYGGRHAGGATHNALICFQDGRYLELLASTGEPPRPDVLDFSVLLKAGEGLAGYALRADRLDDDLAAIRARGVAVGPALQGERQRDDGVRLAWKMVRIGESFAPFFIQDITPHRLRVPGNEAITTHPNGVFSLRGIEISSPQMTGTLARYAQILGFPPHDGELPGSYVFELGDSRLMLRAPEPGAVQPLMRSNNVETLYAVHVAMSHPPEGEFDLGKAHGVRFVAEADRSAAGDGETSG